MALPADNETLSLDDVLKSTSKTAVKTKPSYPHLTDEYTPTDENLWKVVLEVAKGDRMDYTRAGRTIHSPNEGQGYRNMPHNPKGIAWAVKQYNGFGANWKPVKELKEASEDKIPGGLADKGAPKGLDPKQLEMGIKVEMEHTDDPAVAREIALDHLTEDPKYYTKLKQVKKTAAEKYKGIDFKPPAAVADAASKGLDFRQKQTDKAGLTPEQAAKEGIGSGVQRAVNLKNRDTISPKVINQMVAFFSRHEKNKSIAPEHKDEPWKDKGYVSWLLWGGDPGKAWAEKVQKQIESADKKASWVPRLRRMAAGGVEVTEGAETLDAQQLASRGLLRLFSEAHGRSYWNLTEEGQRVVLAGLTENLKSKLEKLLKNVEPQEAKQLGEWIEGNFRINSPKTPRGAKPVKELMQKLVWVLKNRPDPEEIQQDWDRIKPQLSLLVKFTDEGGTVVPKEVTLEGIRYINDAGLPEAQVRKYAKRLGAVFKGIQGWRKKALSGSLTVNLKAPRDFNGTVTGKYRKSGDEMWVRTTPAVLKRAQGYGSFEYIITHELGHRYESFNKVPTDFDKPIWWTTRYSRNEGESFAELFALSNHKLTGSWDQAIVERFDRVMTGQEKVAAMNGVNNSQPPTLKWVD